jgi:L-fuculose-phosphate aldolase
MTHQQALQDYLAAEIVRIGQLLYEQRLIVAGDGNISVRLDNDLILMTPAGLCKGMLTPDDMVVVDLDGHLVQSLKGRTQSTEQLLHLLVYKARPDVQAVVHAHPPTAVAATMAGVSMATELLPETVLTLGTIPTAPYALTGTPEVFESVAPFIQDHNAILLSHHGALTVGGNLQRAFMRMEQIEHAARILLAAHLFGGAQPLPGERLEQLRALREKLQVNY